VVIPKRHSADLAEISADDLAATTPAAQRIARVVLSELGAYGVNLLNCCGAAAWQTVFHFHLHVIPRYRDKARTGWSCRSSPTCQLMQKPSPSSRECSPPSSRGLR